MKKGAGRRRLAFCFLVSGCSVRRSATRNGGGPHFEPSNTAIHPRIPNSDRALNRDLPLKAIAAGRHPRVQLMGPGSPARSHRLRRPARALSPLHAAG